VIDAIKRLRNRDGSPTKASARASGRSNAVARRTPPRSACEMAGLPHSALLVAKRRLESNSSRCSGLRKTDRSFGATNMVRSWVTIARASASLPHMGIARGENAVRVGIA